MEEAKTHTGCSISKEEERVDIMGLGLLATVRLQWIGNKSFRVPRGIF
jgi:hypothetical protein